MGRRRPLRRVSCTVLTSNPCDCTPYCKEQSRACTPTPLSDGLTLISVPRSKSARGSRGDAPYETLAALPGFVGFPHPLSAAPCPARAEGQPYRPLLQRVAQALQVGLGAPDLGDEALVGHVEAAHVQHVVDGFHFLHLDGAGVDGLGGFTQHLPQVVLCFVKHLGKDKRGHFSGVSAGHLTLSRESLPTGGGELQAAALPGDS